MKEGKLQLILFRSLDVMPLHILVSESVAHREGLPDMDSWFRLAYPDATYRSAIIQAWHTEVEQSLQQGLEVAEMPALIRCKNGQHRWFVVTAQLGPMPSRMAISSPSATFTTCSAWWKR